MTQPSTSTLQAAAAAGSHPATDGDQSPPIGTAVVTRSVSAGDQAPVPTTAEVIADLWADLDAHARLRSAQEASPAMQSRQRFD